MEPEIGRSIREGFRVANRSWPGIGFVAGIWLSVFFVVLLLIVGGFGMDLLQKVIQQEASLRQAAQAGEASAVREQQEKLKRLVNDEFQQRSWPVLIGCLLIALLVLLTVSLGLYGGQMGYLVRQIRGEPARVSDFWIIGKRTLGPLLGSSVLACLVGLGGLGLPFLLLLALSFVSKLLSGILAVLFVIAAIVVLIWLSVRLCFWPIAIVAERFGPIAGLKASFRATQGRWGKIALFILVFVLIQIGGIVVFTPLQWLGGLLGSIGSTLLLILRLVVLNLYLPFALSAALIRFYEDTKSTPA